MKKLFLATTAFVVLAATSAGAADMTARPAYAPPPPAYSWSGFYIGGNVGYGWGTAKDDATESTTMSGVVTRSTTTSNSQEMNGVIGGVQAGYNYQLGTWVWGWETDFQGSGQKGSSTFNGVAGGPLAIPFTVTADHKLEWFGTARSRLGVLWGSIAGGAIAVGAVTNFKDVKAGWTAGAGAEAALGGGWSAKLEYLYIDLGKTELTTAATAAVAGATVAINANHTFRDTDNILRVGLNYKWGGAGYGY